MTSPDVPLDPTLLDELLNAELDGELDRAATELGFTPASAREALVGDPRAPRRRDALLRARDLLAGPPPLTPEDEQRLIAHALTRVDELDQARDRRTAQRRRESTLRVVAAAVSAAAVIGAIVGLASIRTGGSNSAKSSAAPDRAATATTNVVAKARAFAFGQVANADRLRTRAVAAIEATVPTPPSTSRSVTTTYDSALTPGPQGPSGSDGPSVTGPTGPVGATGPTGDAGSAPRPEWVGGLGAPGVVSGRSIEGVEGLAAADGLLAMAAPRGLVGTDGVVVKAREPAPAFNAPAAAPDAGAPPLPAEATAGSCVEAAIGAAGPGYDSVVTGSASYGTRPAVVVVLRNGDTYVAYVLAVPGCTPITHVAVP